MDKYRDTRKFHLTLKGLLEQMQGNMPPPMCALRLSESSQTLIDGHLFRQASFQEAEFWRPAGEAMEEALSPKSD